MVISNSDGAGDGSNNITDASRPVRSKKSKVTEVKENEPNQWKKKTRKRTVLNGSETEISTVSNLPPPQIISQPTSSSINTAKIKRPTFQESKNGITGFHGPAKRPRGRPPLPANRIKSTIEKADVIITSSSTLPPAPFVQPSKYIPIKARSTGLPGHYKAKHNMKTTKNRPPALFHGVTNGNIPYSSTTPSLGSLSIDGSSKAFDGTVVNGDKKTKGNNAGSSSASSSQTKVIRPPAAVVVNKVLSLLSLSDPVSLSELTSNIPDAPKDLLQAVLEVLRVLGIVVHHKVKDTSIEGSANANAAASSSSSSSSNMSSVSANSSSSASPAVPNTPTAKVTSSAAPSSSSSYGASSSSSISSSAHVGTGSGVGVSVYSLAGFAKGYSSIEITKIEEDIAIKVKEMEELQERNAAWQVIKHFQNCFFAEFNIVFP